MVESIGVRELKARTSEVLRRLCERGEPIAVTRRGRVIARILPVGSVPVPEQELAALWSDVDQLAAEIGARWPSDVSAADAVREQRREL